MTVPPVTRRFSYRLFYRNPMSRLSFSSIPGKTYTCKPDARPMRPEWALAVRDRCRAAGVAFLFKPWGAWGPDSVRRDQKANGRMLAGRRWDERPQIAGALL